MKRAFQKIIAFVMTVAVLAGSMQIFELTAFSVNTPAAPQNVKAASVSYNSIKISWSPVKSVNGYEIYRYNSAKKSYERLAAATSTGYTNTGLTTGSTYSYKVRAYLIVNGKTICGSLSSAVTAKPVPSVPANFKVSSQTENSITLTWSAVSGASGYIVYRYSTITKSYICIKVTKSTSFTNTGLTTGMTYYYKARAYRTVNWRNIYGNTTVTPLPATARAFQLEDLEGKKLAVQACTTSDDFATNLLAQGKIHFTILRYEKITQCFDNLHSGKVDTVLADNVVASSYLPKGNKLVWSSDTGEPMGICLKKGNTDLTALVESAVDTLYYNGTMKNLAVKYFGLDILKGVRSVTVKPTLDLTKLKTIKQGTLKVGMEIGYPPMEYLANDGVTYTGFDVEVAKKIADLFGLKLEIVNTAWDGIFAALNKGEFDMIISAVSITNDRQAVFNLTKPYIMNNLVLVMPN